MSRIEPAVWDVVRALAETYIEHSALAVALTGSHARGDAHAESDVDLHVIGEGPEYELRRFGGVLVSTSWGTAETHRASFLNPGTAGAAVPGWRQAVIVHDPEGVAASLRERALTWDWSDIGDAELDGWVAEGLTGFAEEIHKLVVAIRLQRQTTAATQRSIMALRLAPLMSVRLRLLYDSENGLWDAVNRAMGDDWTAAQLRALGMSGEPLLATCAAALRMWLLATETVLPSVSERQRSVLEHARRLASMTIATLAPER